MEFVELLASYLAASSGVKQDEVVALVKKADGSINTENAKELFDKMNAGLKAKLGGIEKEHSDRLAAEKQKAHDAGLRNGAEKVEKELRERVKIEGNLVGEDLLKALEGKLSGSKGGEITREVVESSTFYLEGINRAKQEAEANAKKAVDELEKYRQEITQRDELNDVINLSQPIIDGLNLALSDDPKRAANQRAQIVEALKQNRYKTERDADGNLRIIGVLDRNGALMKDDAGNPLSHEALVRDRALSLFDQKAGEQRKADVKDQQQQRKVGEGKWTRDMPKDEGEYLRLAGDMSIPLEEREALMQAWEGQGK